LAQDHDAIQLVISDNASTDDTERLCQATCAEHANARYVRHDENIGPTPNFESLRAQVIGDYFMFLGDDDWIDTDYVSTCVAWHEANPGHSLVSGRTAYHRADGVVDLEAHVTNIQDDDPRKRVLRFCREVEANGVFYGVVPTAMDRAAPPLRNVQGGDMVHVMSLAYLGKVRTLDGIVVHRTVDGMTVSLANVAETLGLGWFQRNAPQIAIAYWIFRDIAFDSPLYRELGRGRLWLGVRAGGIVFARFVPRGVVKFARLTILRLRTSVRRSDNFGQR
jgi:glycosyltransferase involved in cell wall biosynthesis